MNLSGLLDEVRGTTSYGDLLEALKGGREIPPLGLIPAARPYLAAALARDLGAPLLLVAAGPETARDWADELRKWLGPDVPVYHFATPDSLPYERIPWATYTIQERLRALVALARESVPVVVTSARAVAGSTVPRREMRLSVRSLKVGQIATLGDLLRRWFGEGYRLESVVEEPGTIARRGGILDIWPPNLPRPVRVEFFGDEVDSLRFFDPGTQLTTNKTESVLVGPGSEAFPRFAGRAISRMDEMDFSTCHPPARRDFEHDRKALEAGQGFPGAEYYIPLLYPVPGNLLDHLPEGALVFLDEGEEVAQAIMAVERQADQIERELIRSGEIPAGWPKPHSTWQEISQRLDRHRKLWAGQSEGLQYSDTVHSIGRLFWPAPIYNSRLDDLASDVEEIRRLGSSTVLITRQASRVSKLLSERGVPAMQVEDLTDPSSVEGVLLIQGTSNEGFVIREREDQPPALVLLTDVELFGWRRARRRVPRAKVARRAEAFFSEIKPGDYVVHIDHGIGRFGGLVRMKIGSVEQEYLLVEYAQGDRLYVPVQQTNRLSKYVSPSDVPPTLHRLHTTDWSRAKKRAKQAVAEIARDLLALYAAREMSPGHAFPPDTPWQKDLEAAFSYQETEDQLRAIAEVKKDMESPSPMDRLVCGDVGYGKTEVAIRAAFKAIMDGKQVALLAPTTVLAQQHFYTFKRRLDPFPVNVAMLSRLQTQAQQRKVLQGLADGSVDLVIGTHRLLSKDVRFKDLGLIIVDEEQRFGVYHKERLKQLRHQVDVLTLTATPIPRTLYLSLAGVRDMSLITSPPEDRLPIKTFVSEFDRGLIRKAILRELDRGGQVYFVHNRVRGIRAVARMIRDLVPEAIVEVAHGQMRERHLSEVMLSFTEGNVDVLVCTTIIENGLDVPNANTIIINNSHRFGLAQLYQLRGRVGRGAVRAYAYLLYPRGYDLPRQVQERLEMLAQASEAGAGFQIAMRDLEVRGAGEILGARQHGHMTAVGMDMYTRLLAQAVKELKEQQQSDLVLRPETVAMVLELEPSLVPDLPLAASIPEEYVPSSDLRLRLYRQLSGIRSLKEMREFASMLRDRFGPPPDEVKNLLFQTEVRLLGEKAGVKLVGKEGNYLTVVLESYLPADVRLPQGVRGRGTHVWIPLDGDNLWMPKLKQALESLASCVPQSR